MIQKHMDNGPNAFNFDEMLPGIPAGEKEKISEKENKQNLIKSETILKPVVVHKSDYYFNCIASQYSKEKEDSLVNSSGLNIQLTIDKLRDVIKKTLENPEKGIVCVERSTFDATIEEERSKIFLKINKFCISKIDRESSQMSIYYLSNFLNAGSFGLVYSGYSIGEGGKGIAYKKAYSFDQPHRKDCRKNLKNEEIAKNKLINLNGGKPIRGIDTTLKLVVEADKFVIITDKGIEFDDYAHVLKQFDCDLMDLLTQKVKKFKVPTLSQKYILAHYILDALRFFAEKGVAHRDLKPENIFIQYNQKNDLYIPKIGDLDSTRYSDDDNIASLFCSPTYTPWEEVQLEKEYFLDFNMLINGDDPSKLLVLKKYEVSGGLTEENIAKAKNIIIKKQHHLFLQRDVFAVGKILYGLFCGGDISYATAAPDNPYVAISKNKNLLHFKMLGKSGVCVEIAQLIVQMLQPLDKNLERISGIKVFNIFDEAFKIADPLGYKFLL